LALDPEDVRARQQLGNALLETGEIEAAIAAYRGALERSPRQASLWVNLAVGLQQFGDLGGALGAVDAALQLDPGSGAAWAVRAGLKRFAADDPDLAALSRLLAAPKLLVEDRTRVEFALGKAFDDIGDAQKAFAHLTTGNRLHRSAHPYNVSDDLEQFAEIARALSPQTFSTLSGAGDPSRRPVFIVGMPRSGTSLVEQILASHPDVWGGGEQTVLERLLIERTPRAVSPLERARSLRDLQVSDLSSLGSDYVAEISKISSGALRVTDKMPLNFRFVGLIHLILPNAQIVHCRRDPLDTCLSCFAQNFSRGQDWSYDLEDLGRYYRGYERLMSHWREQTPPGRLLEISYEALVADLEGESRRLLAFCGLPWDSACLSFHETRRQVRTASVAQVRQPIYPRSVGRAVRYRPYLGPLMAALNL
jgi:tetratricopeptide (TPR) repeat protein